VPQLKKTVLAATLLVTLAFAVVAGIIMAFPNSNSENKTEPTKPPNTKPPENQWSAPTRISSSASRYLCMSVDGKKIAYLDTYDLYLMNSDGTDIKKLTNYEPEGLSANSVGRPTVNANCTKIAFKASKQISSGWPDFIPGSYEAIFIVNPDGTGLTKLFPSPNTLDYAHLSEFQHELSDPSISGDGKKVTFVSDSQLYIINSDGTGLKLLSSNAQDVSSVSADGNKVAFIATGANQSQPLLIDSNGTELTKVSAELLSAANYAMRLGTHSAVSLSGNGNKMVFTSNNPSFRDDLYIINADGTGLLNLYHNVTTMISTSYDGNKIAFVSYGSNNNFSLCVVNSDGTEGSLLSSNAEPYSGISISADGKKIAFSYMREFGTFVSELGKVTNVPETTATPAPNNQWNTKQIMSLPSGNYIGSFCASSDGSKIAFTASSLNASYPNIEDLYVVNSDGSGLQKLYSDIEESTGPSISGDGKKISFISNSDLYIINSDGTGLTKLIPRVKFSEFSGYYFSPAISGDGSKVAVVVETDYSGPFAINKDLYLVNSDGTEPTKLSSDIISTPSISWDGSKITFLHYPHYSTGDNQLEGVCIVNSDGTGLRQLTNKTEAILFRPLISGDGSKVAFTVREDRWDADGYNHIYVINSDGTNLRQLTNDTWNDVACSMNFNGELIAFVSKSGQNSEIAVINSDGSGFKEITQDFVTDSSPYINTVGSKIAFYAGLYNISLFVTVYK
jgi:TolB protein